jgi:hypothetical protein
MNNNYEKALEFANYQYTLSLKQKQLKEQNEARLTYGYNGGLFRIDQTLINFVEFLISKNRVSNTVLLDSHDRPVLIEDLNEFQSEILDRYFSSVNEYFEEHQKIKKQRSVEKLLND